MIKSESQLNCLVCDKIMSDKNYAISRHVKIHGLSFQEYIRKYYNLTNGKYEKCGFCDRDAIPKMTIDHLNLNYTLEYSSGYFCGSQICKNLISETILGEKYDPKKFEKIGSKSEYLSKLYKIDIELAKSLKYKKSECPFKSSLDGFITKFGEIVGKEKYKKRVESISRNSAKNKFPCTLENFIRRYGIELGTKKYKDRCEKISYTSTKDFFIDKYGEKDGNIRWKNKNKQLKSSKKSKIISKILDNLSIKYEVEKSIGKKFVDYYLIDYDIVIEYFGDFWHANPKIYDPTFTNSRLKYEASEIWRRDSYRISEIKNHVNSIIIIWESSNIDESILEKVINDIKDKKITIYL